MRTKKLLVLFAAIMVMAMVLTACDAVKYEITTLGGKSTIKVNNAPDGEWAETPVISVGKNRHAIIEPALDKGQLQMDFVEVTVFGHEDDPDDVVYHDTVASVMAASGSETVPLEKGDYVVQLKAIGETNGTVVMQIEKE